jgi:hypothetical protein
VFTTVDRPAYFEVNAPAELASEPAAQLAGLIGRTLPRG